MCRLAEIGSNGCWNNLEEKRLSCLGKLRGPRYEFSALFYCRGSDLPQSCSPTVWPTYLLALSLKQPPASDCYHEDRGSTFLRNAAKNTLPCIPLVPPKCAPRGSVIHFSNGDCEVFLFCNEWDVLLKIMAKRLKFAMYLLRMTVRMSN
jgi:hypothetical protein